LDLRLQKVVAVWPAKRELECSAELHRIHDAKLG
jgi:hypothetical protein